MNREKTVGYQVRTLTNKLRRRIEVVSQGSRLDAITWMHGWAIGYLSENRGRDIYQRDIEREFAIRRSTATRILQVMERNRLITRVPVAADRRLKRLVLTRKALDANKEIRSAIARIEAQVRRGVSSQELETFFAVVKRMMANIE